MPNPPSPSAEAWPVQLNARVQNPYSPGARRCFCHPERRGHWRAEALRQTVQQEGLSRVYRPATASSARAGGRPLLAPSAPPENTDALR